MSGSENLGEVHLFTGPNGTGKSRLLSACAAIGLSPNKQTDLRTPRFDGKVHIIPNPNPKGVLIRNHDKGLLRIQTTPPNKFIEAVFTFKGSSTLDATQIGILETAKIPDRNERLSFSTWNKATTNQRIADLKIEAVMDSIDSENPASDKLAPILRMEQAITEITGKKFAVVTRRKPTVGLFFKWGDDVLPISSLPDGLSSTLSWMMNAATTMDLIYSESPDPLSEPAIFFLDEPETHLHPQWQRRILPLAQRIFTGSQFFVATHSPFIVSSLNEGFIYQLKQGSDGLVQIGKPVPASKGDSYISAAEQFLETGEWFDPESEGLLSQFREKRNVVMHGDLSAKEEALSLGHQISQRSQELANIMGPEISRLEKL